MGELNPYRVVPEAEKHARHTFHTFRHFPELASGINATENLFTQSNPTKLRKHKTKKSSSRILGQYCGSSVDELTAVKDFHRTLIEDRLSQKSHKISSTSDEGSRQSAGRLIYSADDSQSCDPLTSVKEKLMKVAIKYDYSLRSSEEIQGFRGMIMTIDEFDMQLKRCLNLWLPRVELEALFNIMSKTETGLSDSDTAAEAVVLDPEAFLTYFFQLGHKARDIHRKNKLRDKATTLEKNRNVERTNESKMERMSGTDQEISFDCTQEDVLTAMEKLRVAAFFLDASNALQAVRVRVFECRMTPSQFRLQLERSFEIKLTSTEIGALASHFGTLSPPYCIDGHFFMRAFFYLQREARKADKLQRKKLDGIRKKLINDRNQADCYSKVLGR